MPLSRPGRLGLRVNPLLARPLLAASLLLLGALVFAPAPATAIQCAPSDGSIVGDARYESCMYAIELVYYTPSARDKITRTEDYACTTAGVLC